MPGRKRKTPAAGDEGPDGGTAVGGSGLPSQSSSGKRKSTTSKKPKVDPEEEAAEAKPVMKSVLKKGLAPVDGDCPQQAEYHVLCEGKLAWDAMLNQTNIQANNNKFYLLQLLQADSGKGYAVWMRWGRVGYKGQNSWTTYGGDLDRAKSDFKKKFSAKTGNVWEEKEEFTKVAGKYDLVMMDYDASAKEEVGLSVPPVKEEESVTESKLTGAVQELIKLISSLATMEQAVVEMEYDTRKAPLGKVTTEQIRSGYRALQAVSDAINAGQTGGESLLQACNEFYTRIPHEFGMRKPPLIKTREMVKAKLQLLEALGDIQVALKLLSRPGDARLHPLDRSYQQLGVGIQPVEKSSSTWKTVQHSIQSTHATTHSQYGMEVLELFKLDKQAERERWEDRGNCRLLYHGSRLSNWAGILGQGLRIAPPEAPSTGYMFGKGVYFADMSSKSANYCYTSRSQPVGLLLLCLVSLGKPNRLLAADYEANKLPAGTHSVQGLGKVEPAGWQELEDGLQVPVGPPKNTKVKNKTGYTLNYNEFIVYNTSQIQMKYLAKVKFNYKY